jgi:hypothetical protein
MNTNSTINTSQGERIGFANTQQIINITINAFPGNGSYFQIATPSQSYYVWFNLNGTGSDPAPGGIGIQINVPTAAFFYPGDFISTSELVAAAINNYQVSTFSIPTSGSSVIPNSYFTFYSNGQPYYVWYNLNGSGTDPKPVGIGIPVTYSVSDSQSTLNYEVVSSINSQYYGTPDLRGQIIKGNPGPVNPSNYDLNDQFRYAYNNPYFKSANNAGLATYQLDMLLGHNHQFAYGSVSGSSAFPLNTSPTPLNSIYSNGVPTFPSIQETGTAQNDVKNVYLNYWIKY